MSRLFSGAQLLGIVVSLAAMSYAVAGVGQVRHRIAPRTVSPQICAVCCASSFNCGSGTGCNLKYRCADQGCGADYVCTAR